MKYIYKLITIVLISAPCIFAQAPATVNTNELLLRIKHIQHLLVKNNAYSKTSEIGERMFEIKQLIRQNDLNEITNVLNHVECKLKKYDLWEE
jgi:hypothetical protein